MRKVWVLAGCLLSWWPALADPLPAPTTRVEVGALQPTDAALIETFVDAQVAYAMQADRIAGVSVAVVQNGRVLMAKGYGLAKLDPRTPADKETLFRVGSISKTPVYIAAMQLMEAGAFTLDTPVNDLLPQDLRIPEQGFSDPIRIRHLMSHSAGFEDTFAGHLFRASPKDSWPLEIYLQRFRPDRVREAGVRAVYNNFSVALLGYIVSRAAGLPFETYMEERIFRPLGMATATFREPYSAQDASAFGLPAPAPADSAARFSDGFRWDQGAWTSGAFEYVTQAAPAGGMSASAADMAQYMMALLDPQTLEQAGVLPAGAALAMREPLFRNHDGVVPIRHGFIEYPLPGERFAFGHGGDLIRFHADMLLVPDAALGVYISTNTETGTKLRDRLARDLIARFFPPAAAVADSRPDDAVAQAAQVAGIYLSERRPLARAERLLGLFISESRVSALPDGDILVASGGDVRRIAPIGGLRYRHAETSAVTAFEERDGVMRLYSAWGANVAVRSTWFDTAAFPLTALAAAAVLALMWVASAGRHAWLRTSQSSAEAWAARGTTFASLLWIGGTVLFGIAALRFSSGADAVVLSYPGLDFASALWALAAAAAASALALALTVRSALGAGTWGWLRRSLQALALCAFGVSSYALWQAGVLGYSGF